MNIFITGASGFIGYQVLKKLDEKGYNLLILQNERRLDSDLIVNHRTILGNLNELVKIKSDIMSFAPDVCMHFAWEGIPDYSANISKKNLCNSTMLCDFLINETNCKKLIVSGSCFEYGKTYGACKEDEKMEAKSFFAWAKQSLYDYLNLLCKNKEVNLFWGRIFYVYGPRQRKVSLIPAIVDSFTRGQVPQINNPLNANDFVYVEDIAEAFCRALEADIPSGTYNLGSGVSTEVIRICRIIEKELFKSTCLSDEIFKKTSSNQEINFWADMRKTTDAISWQPSVALTSGIHECIQFEKRNNGL